mmetsp:Transcript_40423/g.107079  ORF Transcript_40423/g.107079 Transcript_40423/m.107079 type:complete len:258 (+) Transcript_40423:25-798(+)
MAISARAALAAVAFLMAPEALAYQLPLMVNHAHASRRTSNVVCEADAPAEGDAAETDPKAAVKAEKKALRDAIANLEARMPGARGELNAALAEQKDAGENGYMLVAANFERFRQQARTEMDAQSGYGRQNTLRSLLPFIERFEELQASSEMAGEGSAIHSYYGGIYKQTQKLLDEWKASPFEAAAGEKFDYNLHQSVSREVSDDVPDGVIIDAIERGWKMGDGVLRQAKVTVSTGPAAKEEAADKAADEVPEPEAAE